MALVPFGKSDASPNPNKVDKFNNYVKINQWVNAIDDKVAIASHNASSAPLLFIWIVHLPLSLNLYILLWIGC